MFISDSNKTISDVLSEFEEDGCLAQYDQNGVSADEIMITMFHHLIKHLLFPVLPRDIKSQSKLMRTNYFYCSFLHLREMPPVYDRHYCYCHWVLIGSSMFSTSPLTGQLGIYSSSRFSIYSAEIFGKSTLGAHKNVFVALLSPVWDMIHDSQVNMLTAHSSLSVLNNAYSQDIDLPGFQRFLDCLLEVGFKWLFNLNIIL